MKVLLACVISRVVREAFAARGHKSLSCDLLPTEIPGNHYQGDIFDVIDKYDFDLMIAHPPCTRLSNSGVRWLHERNLWDEMREAAEFFNRLLDADIDRIAVENPIQHGHARELIRVYDQIIQPYQFGHDETKATCLWIKNLPELIPTTPDNKERKNTIHMMPPGPERWKNRSRTFTGIAEAMADQWGALL